MTYAIGRLTTTEGILLGTAFAVSSTLALTAFHCVGDRQTEVIEHLDVLVHFRSCTVPARVEPGGATADAALLVLGQILPATERPVPLGGECWPHERWYSVGFPASTTPAEGGWSGGFALTGWVSEPDSGYLPVPTVQLHCDQSAASQPLALEGLSGAPVLIGRPARAVGIVRWNLTADHPAGIAAGAAVFAAPLGAVAALYPVALARFLLPGREPALERRKDDEKMLMDELPLARGGRLRRVGQLTAVVAVIAVVMLGGSGSVVAAQAIRSGSSSTAAPASGTSAPPVVISAAPTSSPSEPTARPIPTLSRTPTTSARPRPTASGPSSTPDSTLAPPPSVAPSLTSAAARCDDTRLAISPSSGPVGTVVRFTGRCFQPGERVVVQFATTIISQPTADSTGSVVGAATVPTTYRDFPAGDYRMSASGRASARWDIQPFELTEP